VLPWSALVPLGAMVVLHTLADVLNVVMAREPGGGSVR
jgi:hypothetical protein